MRIALYGLYAAVVLVAGAACADKVKVPELSTDEVERRVAAHSIQVYDCNPRRMFEDAHVPTARWVDYSRLDAKDLPPDKNAQLVFYCASEH